MLYPDGGAFQGFPPPDGVETILKQYLDQDLFIRPDLPKPQWDLVFHLLDHTNNAA
jgi:hypothetical protein